MKHPALSGGFLSPALCATSVFEEEADAVKLEVEVRLPIRGLGCVFGKKKKMLQTSRVHVEFDCSASPFSADCLSFLTEAGSAECC